MSRERWRVVERMGPTWAVQKKLYLNGIPVWAILTTDPKYSTCQCRWRDRARAREICDELNEREAMKNGN